MFFNKNNEFKKINAHRFNISRAQQAIPPVESKISTAAKNELRTKCTRFGFTMAEAVLVMTILGIIATVMITTIKPARFKEQGYKVLAKSVYASIDTAVTQILVDKAPFNKLDKIYKSGSSTDIFNMHESDSNQSEEFIKLLKDYMATARGNIPNVCNKTGYSSILLKNGACISVVAGTKSEQIETWIPGEESSSQIYLSYGNIFVDINGDDEPNVLGKDQFNIPLNINGIEDGSSGEGCPDAGIKGCIRYTYWDTAYYQDPDCTVMFKILKCDQCCGGGRSTNSFVYGIYQLTDGECKETHANFGRSKCIEE